MELKYVSREVDCEYDLSFFVPCLNEQGNIGPTLENIITVSGEFAFTYEILVFDDGSKDGTLAEIESICQKFPKVPVRVVANRKRRGLARNYADGAYIGKGKYYLLVNGDNAEPPESLRVILKEMGRADIIIPIFGQNDTRPWKRRMLSRVFTGLVNFITGYTIGYYNGPALHKRFNVMRWHADTDGFAYQAEVITRLVQEGATYLEVPIVNQDRVHGTSKAISIKNLLAVGHSLTQILLRRIRYNLFYRDLEDSRPAK